MLRSQLCSYESLQSPELRSWSERLRPMWDPSATDPRPVMLHRKMWEWLVICQALAERDMLRPGRRGLGFGVGKEPLVALFAALGASLVATDLDVDRAAASGWTTSGEEHADGLVGLNDHGLCPANGFAERVTYRDVDMNELPADLAGFDFTWSSCAFEHLGSLGAGLAFVEKQMAFLRPGGVAVHTTEYVIGSNDATVERGGTVLYRRRDIEALLGRLRTAGHHVEVDLREGTTPADAHVDVPPFSDVHLRTTLGDHVTTSLVLIIEKSLNGRRARRIWGRRRA